MKKLFLATCYLLLATCLFSQTWHKLGTGVAYTGVSVEEMKVIGGDLYVVGGWVTQYGAQGNCIAKYNSNTEIWDSVGQGLPVEVVYTALKNIMEKFILEEISLLFKVGNRGLMIIFLIQNTSPNGMAHNG